MGPYFRQEGPGPEMGSPQPSWLIHGLPRHSVSGAHAQLRGKLEKHLTAKHGAAPNKIRVLFVGEQGERVGKDGQQSPEAALKGEKV